MLIFETDSAIDMHRKHHIISEIKGYGKNAAKLREEYLEKGTDGA
jgi:hypothetical protein